MDHIGQRDVLYEGLQTSPPLKDVVDQMVGMLVLVKQQQLTEVHRIHPVGHPTVRGGRERSSLVSRVP